MLCLINKSLLLLVNNLPTGTQDNIACGNIFTNVLSEAKNRGLSTARHLNNMQPQWGGGEVKLLS